MTESIFENVYPEMSTMRKSCFRVMRGTETIYPKLLSDEENETLRMLSDKWIKAFDKHKKDVINEIISELDKL